MKAERKKSKPDREENFEKRTARKKSKADREEESKAGRREKSKSDRGENFEKSTSCEENTPKKPEIKPKTRIENKSQKVSKKPCKNRKGRL